jgi:hypothetical protein
VKNCTHSIHLFLPIRFIFLPKNRTEKERKRERESFFLSSSFSSSSAALARFIEQWHRFISINISRQTLHQQQQHHPSTGQHPPPPPPLRASGSDKGKGKCGDLLHGNWWPSAT